MKWDRLKTYLFLLMGIFNTGWILWHFIFIAVYGGVYIHESSKAVLMIEILMCSTTLALGIERLLNYLKQIKTRRAEHA